MKKYNWISKYGEFKELNNEILFEGGIKQSPDKSTNFSKMGMFISDQKFSEGSIEAVIKTPEIIDEYTTMVCGIIFSLNVETEGFIAVGFNIFPNLDSAFAIFTIDPKATVNKWNVPVASGDKSTITPNKEYKFKITVTGSKLEFFVNNVNIITYNFPFLISKTQTGLWCQSNKKIIIKDFLVSVEQPKTFVIMEYSQKYNDLYTEVIKPVCKTNNIDPIRADESKKTGLILSDIIKRIYEAKFIIAEITPRNPNVFFEIGFAMAIGKPVIFIADINNEENLPFDVSGFRVLFYENSIPGKRKIEEEINKTFRVDNVGVKKQ